MILILLPSAPGKCDIRATGAPILQSEYAMANPERIRRASLRDRVAGVGRSWWICCTTFFASFQASGQCGQFLVSLLLRGSFPRPLRRTAGDSHGSLRTPNPSAVAPASTWSRRITSQADGRRAARHLIRADIRPRIEPCPSDRGSRWQTLRTARPWRWWSTIAVHLHAALRLTCPAALHAPSVCAARSGYACS